MCNIDEEQMSLNTLVTDTYDSLNHISSVNEIKSHHLNL